MRVLLDTHLLVPTLLRRNACVRRSASSAEAKNAVVRLAEFERLCNASRIIPLTDQIVVRAADIYAELKSRGALISDADILIAASALVSNLIVVTNNEEHFRRITGLQLENWISECS